MDIIIVLCILLSTFSLIWIANSLQHIKDNHTGD